MARVRVPSPRTVEAACIIASQVGCDEEEALVLLRDRAASFQYRVHTYAQMVIDGIIRFEP
jgi:serine/threonine-protein kinase RIO1